MAKNFSYANSGDGEIFLNSFVEISIDPVLLNNFAMEDGIGAYFATCAMSDEFQALRQELVEEVMHIVNNCLTDKQREVMYMTYVEGKTQNEISNELGKHQTTIHKILQGNIDYNNQKKRYGGALKKIRKLCVNSEKIQDILLKMKEHHSKVNY